MFDFSKYQAEIDKQSSKLFSSVGDYLSQQILNAPPLVKTGPNPGGNLSQEQLKAGMRPVVQTVVPNNNKSGGYQDYIMPIGIAAAALVVLYFVIKK